MNERTTLPDSIARFCPNNFNRSQTTITQIITFSEPLLSDETNTSVFKNLTTDYVISTIRFKGAIVYHQLLQEKVPAECFLIHSFNQLLFTFIFYFFKLAKVPNLCAPNDCNFFLRSYV